MCTPSSTPIHTIPVLPLLSHFEQINRRKCPGMSWSGPFSLLKLPLHQCGSGLSSKSNTCFLGPQWLHTRSHPKRHLDQFSHLCRAHDRYRQTQTDRKDRTTLSVAIGGVELVLRCDLIIITWGTMRKMMFGQVPLIFSLPISRRICTGRFSIGFLLPTVLDWLTE